MKIALIGGGKMGEAILAGLLASTTGPAANLDSSCFIVANPGQAKRDRLSETYGVTCVADAREIEHADVIILAVKPQVMPAVLESLTDRMLSWGKDGDALYISIAAGLTTQRLKSMLAPQARVVRTMPNTPLLMGVGMTAVVGDGGCASEEDVCFVRDLFACLGNACVVAEAEMDAVCAVSGSGPAYVAAMVEALRDGGVKQGLSFDLAQELALQTVFGTATLLRKGTQTPDEVRLSVCSPGGTTLAALDAMYAKGFTEVFESGVAAATKRSKELGA